MKTTTGTAQDSAGEFLEASNVFLKSDFMPRLLHCVNQFSEADLWWRPNESSNSVGNMMLHLVGNLRQWNVEALGGIPTYRDRDAEFAERGPISKAELIAKLESAVSEVIWILEHFDADRLLERHRIQKYNVTALQAIYHIVEHFSYHLGQIIYIYKLRTGEDLKFY